MNRILVAGSFIIVLCIALFLGSRINAQEKKESENLYVLADDLKFKNGVEFMKLKMYHKAAETFNEYLEIYPHGIHRADAYRYLAELFAAKMEYLKAIEKYRALYEEFGNTEAGIEAYFNIGLCYQKMGYDKEAAEVLNDLIQNHGDSPYAREAKTLLDVQSMLSEDRNQ